MTLSTASRVPSEDPKPPARTLAFKLTGGETGDSLMMFELTLGPGARSTLHLHHESDETAYVLAGEITFLVGDDVTVHGPGACVFMPRGVRHAWKCSGAETGRVLILYTPAKAGGLIEEQERTGRKFGAMDAAELADILSRHSWSLLGPSPL